jgi:glycosyltransferase involved in cell wall biosynthesis
MVSFQAKLTAGLNRRGIQVTYDLEPAAADALLVVGGSRRLDLIRKAQKSGLPVLQRLDGINWIHRKRSTGVRHYLRAEIANWLLATIRRHFASGIIYQSQFVVDWWERQYGATPSPKFIVHNGVDLERYTPEGVNHRPSDRIRVLMVEGALAGGYELGLEHAIAFCERLARRGQDSYELMIVGRADELTRKKAAERSSVPLHWTGLVKPDEIPAIDRSAHLFFAADIHPACPNAVIEALACGLPIIGFDTGALKELVPASAGKIVPYGGDPWNLEQPDFGSLADAALEVLSDQESYQKQARSHAENSLGLEQMIDGYLNALGWG